LPNPVSERLEKLSAPPVFRQAASIIRTVIDIIQGDIGEGHITDIGIMASIAELGSEIAAIGSSANIIGGTGYEYRDTYAYIIEQFKFQYLRNTGFRLAF
jgi:hypothetical protein